MTSTPMRANAAAASSAMPAAMKHSPAPAMPPCRSGGRLRHSAMLATSVSSVGASHTVLSRVVCPRLSSSTSAPNGSSTASCSHAAAAATDRNTKKRILLRSPSNVRNRSRSGRSCGCTGSPAARNSSCTRRSTPAIDTSQNRPPTPVVSATRRQNRRSS